jgi:glucokinase
MILCGDIGGTKTLLAVAEGSPTAPRLVHERQLFAAGHDSFDSALRAFLADWQRMRGTPLQVQAACLGVAGPLSGNAVQMTNLPWRLSGDGISAMLAQGGPLPPVRLVNDFMAAATGVGVLPSSSLVTLQDGEPVARAPQLVIGAGSGLGVALRVWTGLDYLVIPGEGGHYGFAPSCAEHDDLLHFLRGERPRVVAEHVVSGPGLAAIHRWLSSRRAAPAPARPLTGEAVHRLATQDSDPLAVLALEHFVRAYGSVAGDYALASLARGGVFLAGGIAAKCLPWMQDGRFIAAFGDKGPYARLMQELPIHVVTEPRVGLLGAASLALGQTAAGPA